MVCPNCYSIISGNPAICPRCGWNLQSPSAAPMQASAPVTQLPPPPPVQFEPPVPLTGKQKGSLLLSLILNVLALGFTAYIGLPWGRPGNWFSLSSVIYIVVASYAIYSMSKRIRDYAAGVAQVVIACMEQKRVIRGRHGARNYFGRFTGLGEILLNGNNYDQYPAGYLYRVVYSPVSKHIWSIEPAQGTTPTSHQPSFNQW